MRAGTSLSTRQGALGPGEILDDVERNPGKRNRWCSAVSPQCIAERRFVSALSGRELLCHNFFFGNGLSLDPVEQFREHRLDVFPDITRYNDEQQIISRLE